MSKDFRVFNLSRKTIEKIAHVTFIKDSFIHDQIDHPSSISSELNFIPSDPNSKFLPDVTELVFPNVDHIISSQSNSEDQPVVYEEANPSNLEDYVLNNSNECTSPRIL